MAEKEKIQIDKIDKRILYLLIIIALILLIFNFRIIFIIFLFILILYLIFTKANIFKKYKKEELMEIKKVPYYFPIIIVLLIFALSLIDNRIILILGGFSLFFFSYDLYKKRKIDKQKLYFYCIVAFIVFILGIQETHLNTSNIFRADFISNNNNYEIAFNKNSDPNSPYGSKFENIIFIGIQTPENLSQYIINFDQVNITIEVNVSKYILGTHTPFWITNMTIRLLYWNDYVDSYIKSKKLEGIELFNAMANLKEWTDFYKENNSYGINSISLTLSYCKMGTYLVGIYTEIDPFNSYNDILYTLPNNFLVTTYDFQVISTLNFGLVSDILGYSWIAQYIMERTQAENLFDDLFGTDILNLILLFFIIFFSTMLISLINRNIQLVKIVNIILICLFFIGLFAVLSNGLNNVPRWLTFFAGERNAKYIWGIFEIVNYSLVLGTVLGIIFSISLFITTSSEAIFSFINRDGYEVNNINTKINHKIIKKSF